MIALNASQTYRQNAPGAFTTAWLNLRFITFDVRASFTDSKARDELTTRLAEAYAGRAVRQTSPRKAARLHAKSAKAFEEAGDLENAALQRGLSGWNYARAGKHVHAAEQYEYAASLNFRMRKHAESAEQSARSAEMYEKAAAECARRGRQARAKELYWHAGVRHMFTAFDCARIQEYGLAAAHRERAAVDFDKSENNTYVPEQLRGAILDYEIAGMPGHAKRVRAALELMYPLESV